MRLGAPLVVIGFFDLLPDHPNPDMRLREIRPKTSAAALILL
jgi:hypothetical protein